MRKKKARGLQGEVKPDEPRILKLVSSRSGRVRPDVSYFV